MSFFNSFNYNKPVVHALKNTTSIKTKSFFSAVLPNPANAYMEQQVKSARPEELTLMLYEGMIKYIIVAKKRIDLKDISGANNAIQKAESIVSELQMTLDMKYQISYELDALYTFMFRRLVEANVAKNAVILDDVLFLAEQMRDTWKEAMALV